MKRQRFLFDGIVRRGPATPNKPMILMKACCKRKKVILMDGIVKGKPATTNMILAS